jgi:hypothetical protein
MYLPYGVPPPAMYSPYVIPISGVDSPYGVPNPGLVHGVRHVPPVAGGRYFFLAITPGPQEDKLPIAT